jgi:CRP-like cAMP-binding protein
MSNDFFQYGPPAAPTPAPRVAEPAEPAEGARAILGDLSDEDWEKFIGFAARRRYPDRAVIFEHGEVHGSLGFVASGTVEVQADGAKTGALRGEGAVFGLLGFLDNAPSPMRICARGSTEVLLLTREALLQLAAWQPRIAVALLRDAGATVASRLRALQQAD